MRSNPIRAMTPTGRENFLNSIKSEDTNGALIGLYVFFVASANVNTAQDSITNVVVGAHGFDVGKACSSWTDPRTSANGKMFTASNLLTWTGAGMAGTQTFRGVAISSNNTTAGIFSLIEFDEDISVDEDNETVEMKLEVGYQGWTMYITPRVIPLGE